MVPLICPSMETLLNLYSRLIQHKVLENGKSIFYKSHWNVYRNRKPRILQKNNGSLLFMSLLLFYTRANQENILWLKKVKR